VTERSLTRDPAAAHQLYEGIKASVQAGIADLRREQAADPQRQLLPRVAASLASWAPAFDLMAEVETRLHPRK
jgi:hypothetical protein